MNKIQNLILKGNIKNANSVILHDINLDFEPNKIYAIFGKNGSGKSTLLKSIFSLENTKIDHKFYGQTDLNDLEINEIANLGMAIAFQEPPIINSVNYEMLDKILNTNLSEVFKNKNINKNISGGEKKYSEILQIVALKPNIILLDEIDSGVDLDSLKKIISELQKLKNKTIIIVSHSGQIFNFLKPDYGILIKNKTIGKIGKFSEIYKSVLEDGYEQN